MKRFRVKDWKQFQHFKDRLPPWIKLYRKLIDDPEYHALDPVAAKYLILVWLIASEDETKNGTLPECEKLAFRLRITIDKLNQILTKLSHWLIQDDINTISGRCRDDAPETETETETETEVVSDFSPQTMVNLWNAAIDHYSQNGDKPKTPKVRGLTKDRKRSCMERIKDCELDEAKWKSVLNAIHTDDWLSGRSPSAKYPNWKATFDYVIAKSSTTMRLIEGYQSNVV